MKYTPFRITYENSGGGDLIYVYLQDRKNYKNHPLTQEFTNGFHYVNESGQWIGLEFILNNEKHIVYFAEENNVGRKIPAEFIIDVNDLGVFGVEDIDSTIDNIDIASFYFLTEDERIEDEKQMKDFFKN